VIPTGLLDLIENQRRVLVTVITLLHCLHVVLAHEEESHIDEETDPRVGAAVRWTSLPEMTVMLMKRTHAVLTRLDSTNLARALEASAL
jgi:hypothetical protein